MPFVFAPITVFYGNVDYCYRFSMECEYSLGADENGYEIKRIPTNSRYIKSEDILYEIKKIQQRQILGDGMKYLEEFLIPDALYLLDEPEVSLSPQNQVKLAQDINQMTRLLIFSREIENGHGV